MCLITDPARVAVPAPAPAAPGPAAGAKDLSPTRLLFGQLAKRYNFVTDAQVEQALVIQEELARIGVMKPIGEILTDRKILSPDQVGRILRAQQGKAERRASRKFAQLALENGFVTEAQVRQALEAQREIFQKTQEMIHVGRWLVQKKHMTEQQFFAVTRGERRIREGSKAVIGRTKTTYGLRECPCCFEPTSVKKKECQHCEAILGELEMSRPCARCGENQMEAGEFCTKCGANILTGEMPGQKKIRTCERCGIILAPDQEACYRCGAWRTLAWPARFAQATATFLALAVRTYTGWIVLTAFVAGGILAVAHWDSVKGFFRSGFYGEMAARFDTRVEEFARALEYQDVPALRRLVRLPPETPDEAVVPTLLEEKPGRLRVRHVKISQKTVEADRATSYVLCEIFREVDAGGNAVVDGPGATLLSNLQTTGQLEQKYAWHWRYVERDWWLVLDGQARAR